MEMAYRERWEAEIAEMRRVLAGLGMKEECKWGKPTYTVGGKNIVILQGFKEYFALGFFQGALLKDRRKMLVQLGQVQAGRLMKFTSVNDIRAKAASIKAYVREAIAVAPFFNWELVVGLWMTFKGFDRSAPILSGSAAVPAPTTAAVTTPAGAA